MRLKRVCVGKRGLSPVIASVLLILLVLVLAVLIFLWARGFVSEQIEKFGSPIENICNEIDFEVVRLTGPERLEVVNRGNVDIFNLEIKMIRGGDSETSTFEFPIDAGAAVTQEVSFVMEDGLGPEKVIVYPSLVGNVVGKTSNRAITCLEQGITLEL
jgi:flagellin-like protein